MKVVLGVEWVPRYSRIVFQLHRRVYFHPVQPPQKHSRLLSGEFVSYYRVLESVSRGNQYGRQGKSIVLAEYRKGELGSGGEKVHFRK